MIRIRQFAAFALLFALAATPKIAAASVGVKDPTSGNGPAAIDTSRNLKVRPSGVATFRASTATAQNGVVVAAASAAPFMCIYGVAGKTVLVQRIHLGGGDLTAVAYATFVVDKYSTAVSAGTIQTFAAIPLDASTTAVAAPTLYTAAPTAGTLVGPIASKRVLLQATTAAAGGLPQDTTFDFRPQGDNKAVTLTGTAQGVCVHFAAVPATAVTLSVDVEWTEE